MPVERLGQRTAQLARGRRGAFATLAAAGLFAAEALALLPFRERLSSGAVGLALLAPVLVGALGGRRSALVVAAVGALAFNVVFTRPYGSLRIASGEAVAAFVAYLAVGGAFGVA